MNPDLSNNDIIAERKRRIFSVKSFILLALSVTIVAFLLRKLELARTIETLQRSDLRLIAAAVVIYFCVNFFKTLRYSVMLNGSGFMNLFIASSFHNFFNMILPARTGELTFIYYTKKICGVDVAKGIHTLLIARIFDFIVISAIFITALLLYYGTGASPLLLGIGAVFFIVSVLIMINLKYLVIIILSLTRGAAVRIGIIENAIVKKIVEKLQMLVEEFKTFSTRGILLKLTVTSLFIWMSLYLLFYVTVRAFGIPIDFVRSIIGSTGGVLTNVLPINSFGSFGTLEAGWTGGFMIVGLTQHDAIITGFGSHIIDFGASIVLALICILLYRMLKKMY